MSFPSATSVADGAFNNAAALKQLYIPLVRTIEANALTGTGGSLERITINRNATIDATGLSDRAVDFRTYYEGAGAKAMGTYIYTAGAWTGAF